MARRKKARKATRKQNEVFFAAIREPALIRLSFLETTKKTLESMKLFQAIKEIRKHKREEIINLRKQIRGISSALGKIKTAMPHIDLPKEEVKPIKEEKPEEEKVEVKKPRPKTELERIEDELKEIENKLTGIS